MLWWLRGEERDVMKFSPNVIRAAGAIWRSAETTTKFFFSSLREQNTPNT